MVYVPEGEFLVGSPAGEGDDNEHPRHMVYLDAFWIDRTEATNAQYGKCLDAGACRKPDYWDDSDFNAPGQPVVGVTWEDARTYCEWAGARLPTEAEWEKAARGTDDRKYPWGNQEATCQYAVMDDGSGAGCAQGGKAWPVGSKPAGASPYGALDMAGNVWEWVADWYVADYYGRSPVRNPQGPDSGDARGLRGGSWDIIRNYVRSAIRNGYSPGDRDNDVGFRCVVSSTSVP
jgi:formylglycine-generating enzyme required for sulfatase activity